MVSKVEIREGEPVPERRYGRFPEFPELLTLEVGKCAVWPVDQTKKVRQACANASRTCGYKFITRVVKEKNDASDEVKVLKVWRRDE